MIDSRPVDIWLVSLDAPRPLVLSPAERERAARFLRDDDRAHWSRARTALRAVLASYAGCDPLDLAFAIGPHGKPSLHAGLQFNLSHAGEWALIAVCPDIPVGIDIERCRGDIDIARLLTRLGEIDLPESRAALYQRWTVREASSKARGAPLFEPIDPRIRSVPLAAPAGYAAALAMPDFTPQPIYRGGL